MKTYGIAILLGICIIGFPLASFAALDWRIEWDEAYSPYTAKVYIFNPEDSFQTFSLEIGDVAKTDSTDQYAPYLFIGQDVSFAQIAPSERKIFEIIVYKDIDPEQTFSVATAAQYQQELRMLGEKYGKSKSRQYPFTIMGIEPVDREESSQNRTIYRNKRGYWITTIIDHDHIAEQLIRAGEQWGAEFDSIQQAIFYYTQGNVELTGEALAVWNEAFPELNAEVSPTHTPNDCTYFVTVVTSNLTRYQAGQAITIGDILASSDSSLSPVVAAEDVNFNISPNTQTSKRLLRVYLMSKHGQPSEDSEYVRIITHSSQIEKVIRFGIARQYHACAIQDVIWYINHEVPSLTIGKGLWDEIGGYVTPTPIADGRYSPCLGNPTTQPTRRQADGMTFKNLMVLVGAVVPFSLLFRRRGRKP